MAVSALSVVATVASPRSQVQKRQHHLFGTQAGCLGSRYRAARGPGFNDGQLHNGCAQRRALGSHVLFRKAAELGYQINEAWRISGYLDHISNGGLAKEDQSINDLGMRLAYRF